MLIWHKNACSKLGFFPTFLKTGPLCGTKIKVTSISPGMVRTELIPDALRAGGHPALEAEDVSGAILYVLGTPPRVQIHELMIKPIGSRF